MGKRPTPGRRDAAYWQRLRRDRRSNAAAILGAIAALSGTLGLIAALVEGTPHEARANPLYWILMLPMVWWVSDLTQFSARAIRFWTAAMLLSCAGAAFGLVLGMAGSQDVMLPLVNVVVCVLAAAASLVLRRGSLVDREGPAR